MTWWMILLIVVGALGLFGLGFYTGMAWLAYRVMKGFG